MRFTHRALLAMFLASGIVNAAQTPGFTNSEIHEIAGRWIGTVSADIGTMPIALEIKKGPETSLTGTLETGHGTWTVTSVSRKDGAWRLAIKTPDGLAGAMTGRVKDGRLTGEWNFAPRAVGTFELARPAMRE